MFKNMAKILLIPSFLISGLIACANDQNGTQTQTYAGNQNGMRATNDGQRFENPYNHNYNGDYDGVIPYTYTVNDVRSTQKVASRVTDIANRVPGVTRATAIAQGMDIVVGIDRASGTDKKALEQQVKQAVKHSESGYNVYVTSDSDIHFKIRTLFTNMNNVKTSNVTPGIGEIIYNIGRSNNQ